MEINASRVEEEKSEGTITDTNSTGNQGNFRELYQDLIQQFECEKKLNNSMVDALENKVSELIADNDTLKISNIKLKKQHEEYESDISELK
jgi:regulator of replication initiation timing